MYDYLSFVDLPETLVILCVAIFTVYVGLYVLAMHWGCIYLIYIFVSIRVEYRIMAL